MEPFFTCPECAGHKLHECEIGPVITRAVQRINWQYHHTIYDTYWISVDGIKWWVCGNCGWKLPVKDERELIAWLEQQKVTNENVPEH